MRCIFHKVSDERHTLEVIHDSGAREQVSCETRSYLLHDLLHYAIESEAGLEAGFWGSLHKGCSLAELDDRTGGTMGGQSPELMAIEQVVGALSGITKGRSPDQLLDPLRSYASSCGTTLPLWLTAELVTRVQERMRQLTGRWKATAFGSAMELPWP